MHVYLHVPFCARRCSYCDFAIAVRRQVPSAAYAAAVLREWDGWQSHQVWGQAPAVESVYFGGGTPSRLEPETIARILERVASDRPVAPDAEVTLEANPDDVTSGAVRAWRSAGVNRVSLGAQSFDPSALSWMHRTHSAAQIEAAVGTLRDGGIVELSLDLIFGLPASLGRDWGGDLERALALRPDHLSLYGLTVEDHTPSGSLDRPRRGHAGGRGALRGGVSRGRRPPGPGRVRTLRGLQLLACPGGGRGTTAPTGGGRRLSASARRPTAAGASSRQWNLREWSAYERAITAGESPVAGTERLDHRAVALEELYLGLRTREGVSARAASPGHRRGLGRIRLGGGVGGPGPPYGGRMASTRRAYCRGDVAAAVAISRQLSAQRRQISAHAATWGSSP